MAIVSLNTIKNWFRTAKKPTQGQFWDTFDSFYHKDEKLPIEAVNNLSNLINNKLDTDQFDGHVNSKDNPHQVTAEQVGLGDIDERLDAKLDKDDERIHNHSNLSALNEIGEDEEGAPTWSGEPWPGGGVGGGISSATLVVATPDSFNKEVADYVVSNDSKDDLSADGDDVVIQAAINSISAFGGKVVFKEGKYYLKKSIQVPSNVSLAGMGAGCTEFLAANKEDFINTQDAMFTLNSGSSSSAMASIQNLSFKLDNQSEAEMPILLLGNYWNIDSCSFVRYPVIGNHCIVTRDTYSFNNITNSSFIAADIGVDIRGWNTKIIGNSFESCLRPIMTTTKPNGYGTVISNNYFKTINILEFPSRSLVTGNTFHYFGNSKFKGSYLIVFNGGTLVANNLFYDLVTDDDYGISTGQDVKILNNTFNMSALVAIRLASSCSLIGNQIQHYFPNSSRTSATTIHTGASDVRIADNKIGSTGSSGGASTMTTLEIVDNAVGILFNDNLVVPSTNYPADYRMINVNSPYVRECIFKNNKGKGCGIKLSGTNNISEGNIISYD